MQTSAAVSCSFETNPALPFSYIRYSIKDQMIERYFRGSIFINLGDTATVPYPVEVLTTGQRNYGTPITNAEFYRDELSKALWMRKESTDAPFYVASGSHHDFPFDSGRIEFDTTVRPPLNLKFVVMRNWNPSFYIPCDTAKVTTAENKIHVTFEMRRNRLVEPRSDNGHCGLDRGLAALPTSVASFFFSIWSIRGILSSEIRVFSTKFDIAILLPCVVFLPLIGLKLFWLWARPAPPRVPQATDRAAPARRPLSSRLLA
jgi:hypothetical protein